MSGPDKRPTRAAIYCRLSYAPDGSEEKVDRQEGDCRALADRIGWVISEAHIFKDNSRSAWQRNRKRPDWDMLLLAVEAGEVDGILVYHGDRLIRQPWDLEKLLRLAEEKHLPLASPSGIRDLNKPDDRFILRIEAASACRESDNTSRRLKRALRARVLEQGKPRYGGVRAFGFERDNLTVNEGEADWIRQMIDRLLAGQTTYGVIRWLNQNGVRTSTGGPWIPKSLKDMLRRPRIAGMIAVAGAAGEGDELHPACWKPIVDLDTWVALGRLLDERRDSFDGRDSAVRYLLTGLARCGTCGGGLIHGRVSGAGRKRGLDTYVCRNPDCTLGVSRAMKYLDRYVTSAVLARLSDPTLIALLSQPLENGEDITAKVNALLERRRQTKEAFDSSDLMSPADLAVSLGKIDLRIAELRSRQQTQGTRRALAQHLGIDRARWDDLPIDEQRSLVRMLFEITVLPRLRRGRGFEPDRVVLNKRHIT